MPRLCRIGHAAANGMTTPLASDGHIRTFWIDATYQFLLAPMARAIIPAWR